MNTCEYMKCSKPARWTALEVYIYNGEPHGVVGLNVCDVHRPGGEDPFSFWNDTRLHGVRAIGSDDPCFEWTGGVVMNL